MLTDYHLHLQPDGADARRAEAERWESVGGHLARPWIERYTERARARAVEEIAITEHVHRFAQARDWHANSWWRAEASEDVDAYCHALREARESGLPVLVGIEMDWLPGRQDEIAAFVEARQFDLVLGSVHWLGELGVDHPDFPVWPALGAEEVWGRYLDELVAAARSGLFDVLAHPDLPKVFGTPAPAPVAARWEGTVEAIARAGVAIECSSAGLRKPVAELYPDPGLLASFARAGVPVTLSSDAHRPEDVAADYATAVAALRGAGYRTITRFEGRRPSQVEL